MVKHSLQTDSNEIFIEFEKESYLTYRSLSLPKCAVRNMIPSSPNAGSSVHLYHTLPQSPPCSHTCTNMHFYVHGHTHMHMHMQDHALTHMRVCTHVLLYTHPCTYTCAHTRNSHRNPGCFPLMSPAWPPALEIHPPGQLQLRSVCRPTHPYPGSLQPSFHTRHKPDCYTCLKLSRSSQANSLYIPEHPYSFIPLGLCTHDFLSKILFSKQLILICQDSASTWPPVAFPVPPTGDDPSSPRGAGAYHRGCRAVVTPSFSS